MVVFNAAGLKILLICFEKHLFLDWHRVARTVQELGTQGCGGLALWDFLDFVVTYPTPVFILLLPFIRQHVSSSKSASVTKEGTLNLPRIEIAVPEASRRLSV